MITLGEIIADLEMNYTEDQETLAVLKDIQFRINKAHEQALKVGETFRYIRIGEDHPKETETRETLDKVYTPLAKIIDRLHEDVQ